MNHIDKSIQAMAQSLTGGISAMAHQLGYPSVAAFNNRLYRVKGQRFCIDDAMAMQAIANRTDFAAAVAAESGGVFVQLPGAQFAEEDIQAAFMSLSESVGALVTEWREATEDGELTPCEERRLRNIKQRLCGQAAAIIELTRRYYTLDSDEG